MNNIGYIHDGVVRINGDSAVKGDFKVERNGTLIIDGHLTGKLENHGKVVIQGNFDGRLVNKANATVTLDGTINGDFTNQVTAILYVNVTGNICSGKLDNYGMIILKGSITSHGTNHPSGVIQKQGSLISMTNLGIIQD